MTVASYSDISLDMPCVGGFNLTQVFGMRKSRVRHGLNARVEVVDLRGAGLMKSSIVHLVASLLSYIAGPCQPRSEFEFGRHHWQRYRSFRRGCCWGGDYGNQRCNWRCAYRRLYVQWRFSVPALVPWVLHAQNVQGRV